MAPHREILLIGVSFAGLLAPLCQAEMARSVEADRKREGRGSYGETLVLSRRPHPEPSSSDIRPTVIALMGGDKFSAQIEQFEVVELAAARLPSVSAALSG